MPLQLTPAVPFDKLVLIGGGEFSFGDTREIDQFLLSQMGDNRTVAFLPTASGSAEYATHFGAYLHALDPSVNVINVPVYRGRDNRRQKNLNTILSAGMIYLGGGVTNNLAPLLRESPVELAMRDAAGNGVIVAAIGAAASCFGISARDMHGTSTAIAALGWLANTVIDTGFDPQNDTPLRRLMSLPDVKLGLGIPAKTALVISRDGNTQIVGEGQIAAFRKQ